MIKPDSDSQIVELKPSLLRHLAFVGLWTSIALGFLTPALLCDFFLYPHQIEWGFLWTWIIALLVFGIASYPLSTLDLTPYSIKGPSGIYGVFGVTALPLDVIDVQASIGHSDYRRFWQPYEIRSVTGEEKIMIIRSFSREQFDELMVYISERQKEVGLHKLVKA